MLAGFISAMQSLAPSATYTICIPFPLDAPKERFPQVTWLPYNDVTRAESIAACDVWLGLGGSPFQSAQSRWFVDHLLGEVAYCTAHRKPMFFLGIGVQTDVELAVTDVHYICEHANTIWTRDRASAHRLSARGIQATASSDLANIYFAAHPPPSAKAGRIALVANFDYADWPGQIDCVTAAAHLRATEHVWLAQESRELPGAEKALWGAMPPTDRATWQLVVADKRGVALDDVLAHWPSAEWLLTARYHAAIAGAWAGSKIVVIATNEKLRGVAAELQLPAIAPDADATAVRSALDRASVPTRPVAQADRAFGACRAFVEAVRGS